jgi:hypothetical protein
MNGLNLHNLRIYNLFKIVVDHESPLIYNLFGLINLRHTSYPTDQDPLQLLSTGEEPVLYIQGQYYNFTWYEITILSFIHMDQLLSS